MSTYITKPSHYQVIFHDITFPILLRRHTQLLRRISLFHTRISADNHVNTAGICVAFPTRKIYFPLIPTSIYGEKVVPATIYVSGLVNPKVFNAISPYTEIDYLKMDYHDGRDPIDFCGYGKSYTKINIKAPSEKFSQDLWISRIPSLKAVIAWLFSEKSFAMFVVSLVFFSALTGVICGIVVFAEARRSFKSLMKFALIGLSNCLTIIGLIICIIVVRIRKSPEGDAVAIEELTDKGYKVSKSDDRKSVFVVLYFIVFCAIVVLSFMGIYNYLES